MPTNEARVPTIEGTEAALAPAGCLADDLVRRALEVSTVLAALQDGVGVEVAA